MFELHNSRTTNLFINLKSVSSVQISFSMLLTKNEIIACIIIAFLASSIIFSSDAVQLNKQFQKSVLNQLYSSKPYPTVEEKEEMASILGMEFTQVHNWFCNKRLQDKITREAQSPRNPVGKIIEISESCIHPLLCA